MIQKAFSLSFSKNGDNQEWGTPFSVDGWPLSVAVGKKELSGSTITTASEKQNTDYSDSTQNYEEIIEIKLPS